jgi:hypothetical protein
MPIIGENSRCTQRRIYHAAFDVARGAVFRLPTSNGGRMGNNEGLVTKITYLGGPTALIEVGDCGFSPIQHSIRLAQTTSQPRNSLVRRSVRNKSDGLMLFCSAMMSTRTI